MAVMAKFEFKSNEMEFSFPNNVIVKIPYNQKFFEDMKEKGERLLDISKDDSMETDVVLGELMDIIDELLGEDGISDRIFGDREPNIYDCSDIINYIKEESVKYIESRVAHVTPITTNRKQRRSKK